MKSVLVAEKTEAASRPMTIYVAGDPADARRLCREFCMEGMCVTVTSTTYVYTGGAEDGVAVGLINYPRFPMQHHELFDVAERLTKFLMDGLYQKSATLQSAGYTYWYSRCDEEDDDGS